MNAIVLIERYTGHRAILLPRIFQGCGKSSQVDCITIIITLEGTDEMKTEKKKWQQNSLKNISWTNALRKRQQTL